jgi:CheY-like chemotaxis protein
VVAPAAVAHRVLLVEDDNDIRELMTAALEVMGYVVIAAADGQDGLDKLTTSNPLPSLILLDMMMPAMDGQTFRTLQRQNPAVAHIAVVLVSAYPDLASVALEMGALAYVQKPADVQEVLGIVEAHCAALDARAHPIVAAVTSAAAAVDGPASASEEPETS